MDLSNPTNLLIAGLYIVIVGFLTFFSIFGVYILIRYGRSTAFAFTVSILYAFFFLTILSQSYNSLQTLLS